MLSALAALASGAILGLDVGSDVLRASLLAPGRPVDILLTADSRRAFPMTLTVVPTSGAPLPARLTAADLTAFSLVLGDPLAARRHPNATVRH
jgi:hypothetical protein